MFIVTDLVSLNGYFCKQSDQDIASQYTVFRQRLHCLLRFKIYCLRTKIQINLEITACDPPINTCTMNETVSGLWKSQKFYNLFYNNTVPPAVKVTNERVQVRLARVHRWVRSRSVRVHR